MRTRLGLTMCAALIGGALFLTLRSSSQSFTGDLAIEKVERHLDQAGVIVLSDTVREIIRPDGSRAITTLRTFRSTSNPSGWESHETRTLYEATKDVAHEIMPALNMYGSLPLGHQKYAPLKQMSTCVGFIPKTARIVRSGKSSKFGREVETYAIEMDFPDATSRWIIDEQMFPEFGCLVGDKTSEKWLKSNSQLMSKKTTQILSLSAVADDPLLFSGPPTTFMSAKPSEILKKHYALMDRDCPECAIKAGAQFDSRYDKLWAERRSGTR